MGIDYRIYSASEAELEKVVKGEQDIYEWFHEWRNRRDKEDEIDLDKDGCIAYEVVRNVAELFNIKALDGFPHKGSIPLEEYNALRPEKVRELAACLAGLGRKEFDRGFAAADKRDDDYYFTEEGSEDFYRCFYRPMIDFYLRAAERGKAILMFP